ncbi:MAG: hypothetical protein ACLUD2_19660 [Clostridium sp.]
MDETMDLIRRAHAGDEEAREQLVTGRMWGWSGRGPALQRAGTRTGGSVSDRVYRPVKGGGQV